MKFTNNSNRVFPASFVDCLNEGAIVTTSDVSNSIAEKAMGRIRCIDYLHFLNGGIKPGQSEDFHVLLNDFLPTLTPGVLTGHVVLPFSYEDDRRGESILTAPFSITIGPGLDELELLEAGEVIYASYLASVGDPSKVLVQAELQRSEDILPKRYQKALEPSPCY